MKELMPHLHPVEATVDFGALDREALDLWAAQDTFRKGRGDVDILCESNPGYTSEAREGTIVVLDTRITEETAREGIAREVVRHIQTVRKEANYRLNDRIVVGLFAADQKLAEALAAYEQYIARETLADDLIIEPLVNWGLGGQTWDVTKKVTIGDANQALVIIALRLTRRPPRNQS